MLFFFNMYKLDSGGPKENKHISSPGGSNHDLKNYKTASHTQDCRKIPGLLLN